MTAVRHYELRVRGGPAGLPASGLTAEAAARAWVRDHGVADGTVIDARDGDAVVHTFACVDNDVACPRSAWQPVAPPRSS